MGPKYGFRNQIKLVKNWYPKNNETEQLAIARYRYHNLLRKPTFEFALDKMFDITLEETLIAVHPLSSETLLGSKDFKLGFSFVFGESDYMNHIDDGQSQKLLD